LKKKIKKTETKTSGADSKFVGVTNKIKLIFLLKYNPSIFSKNVALLPPKDTNKRIMLLNTDIFRTLLQDGK